MPSFAFSITASVVQLWTRRLHRCAIFRQCSKARGAGLAREFSDYRADNEWNNSPQSQKTRRSGGAACLLLRAKGLVEVDTVRLENRARAIDG